MGNIGNVYTQFPQARLERTDGKGIVKVLGILGVDGKGGYIPEVLALVVIFGQNDVRNLVGSRFNILGIYIR